MGTVGAVQILRKGVPLPLAVMNDLMSVSVSDDLGMAGSFSLKLHSWNDNQRDITWSDDPMFAVGTQLEILLGYVEKGLESVMIGTITGLSTSFSAEQAAQLTVSGQDLRQRMARVPNTRPHPFATDGEVARDIIQGNNLSADVQGSGRQRPNNDGIVQYDMTDLAFLFELASINRYELTIDGYSVYFGPSRMHPVVTLTLGNDALTEFSAKFDANHVVKKVNVRGVDDNQQKFNGTDEVKSYPGSIRADVLDAREVEVVDQRVSTLAEAQVAATSALAGFSGQRLSGSGSCRGNTNLRAGRVVEIRGCGLRFSQRYRVMSVAHSFSTSNLKFSTSFTVNGDLDL